MFDKLTEPS